MLENTESQFYVKHASSSLKIADKFSHKNPLNAEKVWQKLELKHIVQAVSNVQNSNFVICFLDINISFTQWNDLICFLVQLSDDRAGTCHKINDTKILKKLEERYRKWRVSLKSKGISKSSTGKKNTPNKRDLSRSRSGSRPRKHKKSRQESRDESSDDVEKVSVEAKSAPKTKLLSVPNNVYYYYNDYYRIIICTDLASGKHRADSSSWGKHVWACHHY